MGHMKYWLCFLLFCTNVYGASDSKKFSCALNKMPSETFTFKIKNLGKSNVELVNPKSYYGPLYTSSRNKGIHRIIETLVGPEVMLRKRRKGLQIFGEKIGCDYVWINLSKSSGYKKGKIKADFQCDDLPIFRDNLTCTIK